MSKQIAVIYYSQSGQLKAIAEKFCNPFIAQGHAVDFLPIKPLNAFPFPWTSNSFFNTMPECVLDIPSPIDVKQWPNKKYDLIIFAYQPWFLSPSIPAISAMHHPAFQNLVSGVPVITLIGARNMWIAAQQRVRHRLKALGAILIGNVVFADRNPNLISAITIQYWLFSGKKQRAFGILPMPGVSEQDITHASFYGTLVLQHLEQDKYETMQQEIVKAHGVRVSTTLQFIEGRATMLFKIWANAIVKKKKRALWLIIFKYYLMFALFLISPIVILLFTFIIRPLFYKKLRQQKIEAEGLNLQPL
jgi:hypothetical protein